MRPECLRPFASLRANLRHAIQAAYGKTHFAARRSVQTRCRKFEDEALALFGANARSPNRVPQAQPDGWVRERAACVSYAEIGL